MNKSLVKSYMERVEAVILAGPFKDNWASLSAYPVPDWFRDAKIGAFIHWGVYSVPAFFSEWYSRLMYQRGHSAYLHHLKTYGTQDKFGYKDFIPSFKAEKFDATAWTGALKGAGMKYVMPVAEHHDNFKMYESELSEYNSKVMGPMRDVLSEISKACEADGLVMGASNHRAENFWFFNTGRGYPTDVEEGKNSDFYGPAMPTPTHADQHFEMKLAPTAEWCGEWLAVNCELVDKYKPRCVYFDWWVKQKAFAPYLRKFSAYYYNRSVEWNCGVVIFYKEKAFAYGTAVYDMERGGMKGLLERPWQTCTAISKKSWGYTENNDFKKASDLARTLVDTVSKNGNLLLNVGPKANGEICAEELAVLSELGAFLRANGEAIYGSRPYLTYGEGRVNISGRAFSERAKAYTHRDFRFTANHGNIYVFIMAQSKNGAYRIKTLGGGRNIVPKSISVLGYPNAVTFASGKKGLDVKIEGEIATDMPVCLKVEVI